MLFRFFAVFMVGALIADPLGGFLLSQGAWVALITGNLIMLISVAGMFLLPETLVVRQWHDNKAGKTAVPSPTLEAQESEDEEGLKKSIFKVAIDTAREQLQRVREFLVINQQVVVLMVPLLFQSLGKYVTELLLQYSTKRYGWSWSKVCHIRSLANIFWAIG